VVPVDKRDILALIEDMPEQIDPEDLIERLYLLRKLEAAEADVREGRLIPHDELVRRS
jgi:hypothetical protein